MPTENPGQGATWTGAGIGEQQHVLDIAPSPAAQGWRQRFISLGIGIHELAERFPDPSDEELAELGRDVVENGLRHPIVFYCDRRSFSVCRAVFPRLRFFISRQRFILSHFSGSRA